MTANNTSTLLHYFYGYTNSTTTATTTATATKVMTRGQGYAVGDVITIPAADGAATTGLAGDFAEWKYTLQVRWWSWWWWWWWTGSGGIQE